MLEGGSLVCHPTIMNKHQPPENDERFRRLLSEWQVDAALPPRFQERVWKRIELMERRGLTQGFWINIWVSVANRLTQPAFAATYLAIFILLGIGAGWQHGKSRSAKTNSDLKMRYVQMVDPYKAPR